MTRYEAYISTGWQEVGQAYVVAARLRDNGRVELGAVLIDTWCLGVRDATFVDDYSEREFREVLINYLPDETRQSIHPAHAKKLIEGAVDYAQKFGFAPHADYKKVRRVFNGVDAATCTETFTYGKDGKPMFIPGKSFTQERIQRVLTILEARCGKDGFHTICPPKAVEPFDDDDAEEDDDPLALRQDLFDWLEEEHESVPRFYEVSGLITGMQLCPQVIMPTQLIEVLWGPKGRQWTSANETKVFLNLLMKYWTSISNVVMHCEQARFPEDEHPMDVWEEDFEDDRDLLVAKLEWIIGFKRATTLRPEAWGTALTRADLAPEWAVVNWWADLAKLREAKNISDYAKTAPARTLNAAITAIARALRQPA